MAEGKDGSLDINEWLKDHKLSSFITLFKTDEIDLNDLKEWNDDQIFNFIIKPYKMSALHEYRLMKGIKQLKGNDYDTDKYSDEGKVWNRKSWVTLDCGIRYKIMRIGKGKTLMNGDRVRVRYVGQLEDKSVFDKAITGGGFTFTLGKGEVIKGWDIGLKGMKVGGKRKLIIPPKLAYGKKGLEPSIPPNAIVTFTVEIMDINGEDSLNSLNIFGKHPRIENDIILPPVPTKKRKIDVDNIKNKYTNIKERLKHRDMRVGNGNTIKNGDKITVRYVGQLEDKNVFDKNITHGFTFTFGKDKVIKGWDIGLQGMKVGGKRKLIISSKWAYGKKGFEPSIPPNATLTFTVEIMKIN